MGSIAQELAKELLSEAKKKLYERKAIKTTSDNISKLGYDALHRINQLFYDKNTDSYKSVVELNQAGFDVSPMDVLLAKKGAITPISCRKPSLQEMPPVSGQTMFDIVSASLNPEVEVFARHKLS